jgi:hypothetical protein
MANLYAHDPDCDFWFDHYDFECTCSHAGLKPPAADPAQDLRAIRVEIAELKRRIDDLEVRGVRSLPCPAEYAAEYFVR